MGLCGSRGCACAITSSSLQITGDGSGGNPYDIESTGLTVVTSVTRPGVPFLGQQILETDTDRIYYWDGSAWRIQVDPVPSLTLRASPGVEIHSAGTGVLTNWFTYAQNFDVPPWATEADVLTTISYVWADPAVLYGGFRHRIGADLGTMVTTGIGRPAGPESLGTVIAFTETMSVTPGVQAVSIQVASLFGNTGNVAANTASVFATTAHFKE